MRQLATAALASRGRARRAATFLRVLATRDARLDPSIDLEGNSVVAKVIVDQFPVVRARVFAFLALQKNMKWLRVRRWTRKRTLIKDV